jgi:hypothetical protein
MAKRLSGSPTKISISSTNIVPVFVTGNVNKLREVREILAQGQPIEIDSKNLDSVWFIDLIDLLGSLE